MRSTIAVAILITVCGPVLAQGANHSGEQARDIKALSAREQADLLAGRGMGLARAAELNHFPGPAHALELRDRLALTPQQVESARASFERMDRTAKSAGAELVQQERDLDAAFRDGSITSASLAARTADIAALQGRLRAVHLIAPIEMRSVLTAEQIATYDRLRGYTDGSAPANPIGHRRAHPG